MTRKTWLGLSLALGGLLAMTAPQAALAEGAPPPSHVERPKIAARIVADTTSIAPGQSFRLGIQFKMDPHWHMYWQNAGETGLPTRITFHAGDGFDFQAIQWPVPERFVDKIGGVSFGYTDEVVLWSTVRAPDELLEGSQVDLTADASWLVCDENCIPGKAALGLTLPVQAAAEGADTKSDDHPLFERYAARAPGSAAPEGLSVEAATSPPEGVRAGEPFTTVLTLKDAGGAALGLASDPAAAFLPRPADGLKVGQVVAEAQGGGLVVTVKGEASATEEQQGAFVEGVLQLKRGDDIVAFETRFDVPRRAGSVAAAPTVAAPTAAEEAKTATLSSGADLCAGVAGADHEASTGLGGFWIALLFAFVGGIILNAMPCVLPVLSLKVLSLVEQNGSDRKVIWRHGLVYTAGVLVSFAVMAAILLAIKTGGWAFQFQDPTFVAVFVAIVFAFALSLFGVYEITLPGTTRIEGAVASKHGYMSSFTYGVFAVLLGTPCTAPFLGPAMTYAFTQSGVELVVLLLTVGLGLAFPFLLLARFPQWQRLLPKPGPWLETFKKAMGFLLVGTAIFLLSTFAAQVSRDALISYLTFLAVLALALWIYGHWASFMREPRTRAIASVVAVAVTVGAAVTLVSVEAPAERQGPILSGGISWLDFDQVDVKALASEGHTVFIDFTAEWCTTCKVNEHVALDDDRVRAAFKRYHITPVKADFTRHKPEIAAWLERFNEPSVPLYVMLPAGQPDKPIKLPTLLSSDDVIAAVCDAGPSKVQTASADAR
ncbi:MAG: thioredoxin family protein [Myxococcales bacterium]|nr:thioredoxin family protein [Myxococcales bacterium]MCB9736714.1 thioredoxin family protein [Deltaproteobacteria bacterium]